ncbi:MAG: type I methionyl aminopeptidase [Kiritimatiellae bacterium]|nr:type I methionyl aminopeptidase [Kiritimatiellia bacterium]
MSAGPRPKTPGEIDAMRVSGRLAAQVRDMVARAVQPGVTTRELDELARAEFVRLGCRPAFLGYRGYPASVCVSVNDEVVHGIPGARVIQPGDLVSLDVGVEQDGWFGDTATTVLVGAPSAEAMRLVDVAGQALEAAIATAAEGRWLSDVSQAVQRTVESNGFSVVRDFVGHGIGRRMHEEPQVPNFVDRRMSRIRLAAGMTLAIEPMVNAGGAAVRVEPDGWTVRTADGSLSAHVEHTVVVGRDRGEILTRTDEVA